MIRIKVDVLGEGASAVGVVVQAESIKQALKVAGGIFPEMELRVPFPLDPEAFFAPDGSAAGLVEDPYVLMESLIETGGTQR